MRARNLHLASAGCALEPVTPDEAGQAAEARAVLSLAGVEVIGY